MDERRFDAWTKRVAIGASRRSTLKALAAAGATAAAGIAGLGRTDAARRGFSGPTAPTTVPTRVPPTPTAVPPTPTPASLGCASGSTTCGPECCPDATSMCCDNACCYGWCYGEELCCPTPREYCAENNTCCAAGEKCCINGYCYDLGKGQCCQSFECPNNGKCCNGSCFSGPNACCDDFDCPSGQICTENNTCCATTCTVGECTLDGCGRICPCPDGYSCLPNGTCAKACEGGSVFCEEQFCGTCLVEVSGSSGYCANDARGGACTDTSQCPIGQFCTLLDPPSNCVTACRA